MRIQKLLFGTILVFVTLVALSNLNALVVSSVIYLPLLGVFQLPLFLIGLLGVLLTALVFFGLPSRVLPKPAVSKTSSN